MNYRVGNQKTFSALGADFYAPLPLSIYTSNATGDNCNTKQLNLFIILYNN